MKVECGCREPRLDGARLGDRSGGCFNGRVTSSKAESHEHKGSVVGEFTEIVVSARFTRVAGAHVHAKQQEMVVGLVGAEFRAPLRRIPVHHPVIL